MLQGHHLIYFGPDRWHGLWRNRHQLMSRFAQHNRVLYVEPVTDLRTFRESWRKGSLRWHDLWRELRQGRLTEPQSNLYIYHSPTYLPVAGRYPLDRLTWQLWLTAFRATLSRLKFRQPLLWLSRPEMAHLIGRFDERLVIYHVVDEYAAYQSVTPIEAEELRSAERRLLKRADLVVVVSPQLLQVKRPHNLHTSLVANGVDAAVFVPNLGVPDDLRAIPGPRLVYAGLIGARLNLTLLAQLATRRPDWSWVLIGQVNPTGTEGQLDELRRLPNVRFLGLKAHQDIPAYLAACDVCVLPYAHNQEAHYIDPLKLYEGLAAGKPIVATPIPAVLSFGDLIEVATDVSAFETAVTAALADSESEQAAQQAARRRSVAAANTWDARVEQLSMLIQQRLTATAATGRWQ
jgi:glycosyltransferase involved in cell wall biosynthesis